MDKVNRLSTLPDAETSNMSNKELKKLMNQLKQAIADEKAQLQASREERELVEKDIKRCISDRDRLMPVMVQAAGLAPALRELDAEKQRVLALSRQQEELEAALSRSREHRESQMEEMKKKEASLMEEEKRLTQMCDEVRASLAQTLSRCQAAEEKLQQRQDQVTRAASKQSRKVKEEQLVDEHVTKLGIPATLSQVGIKPKRGRKKAV
ncbi:hypothetical protein MATL_G00148200 [Megalops atlanticus]|uniref:Uncharacterized protein n=1 Tax=Megalops atlanticus TaxID=7932 RepID=A0A9D3PW27_MEGAT|nr:hypothetical protein MATL_G00148200 [Megalops atlanticus]